MSVPFKSSDEVKRPEEEEDGFHLRRQSTAVMRGNPMEIVESIKELHQLHQKGGLTEEEFTLAKQQILDSSSSSTASPSHVTSSCSGHHHRTRRRHTHHHAHSHSSSRSTRSRHRSSRSSSSSSSSHSSSSSSSNHFMVLPKPGVWQDLDTHSDHSGAGGSLHGISTLDSSSVHREHHGHISHEEVIAASLLPQTEDSTRPSEVPEGAVKVQFEDGVAIGGEAAVGVAAPAGTSATGRYGTFAQATSWLRGKRVPRRAQQDLVLEPENQVRVHYFNSRGKVGKSFADVELQPHEMRPSVYLRKNKIVKPPTPPPGVEIGSPSSPASPSPPRVSPMPSRLSGIPGSIRDFGVDDVLDRKTRASPLASLPPPSVPTPKTLSSRSHCSSSSASFLEQSLNWHWIDVTGKDASEKHYTKVLRALTRKFNLCESFLVDREHVLVLPQVCESPTHPGQYLLNLRVASQRISLADDSAQLLTNRWIVIIDIHRPVIITLHRIDTRSMALLRHRWAAVMEASEISFQQFLLKIIDDAIFTYQLSLDVHEDLLDKCELKLFAGGSGHFQWESKRAAAEAAQRNSLSFIDDRILAHFADSSSSPFLRQLLDRHSTKSLPKGETNSFLHHLQRRTSVHLRMLILTQPVLAEAFTKLRLCSKELSAQMTSSCRELSDRALEVRDDAKTLLDLHLALQSFRTNELMAVLTRLSLFFTPCTFLAGVYGMNFQNFPELAWTYGYLYFWIGCILLVVGMQIYFYRVGLH